MSRRGSGALLAVCDHERKIRKVRKFLEQNEITHPVLIDNDFRYWNKLGNRYWPAFYLVDRQGRIRHLAIGETHVDTPPARDFERRIEALLAE